MHAYTQLVTMWRPTVISHNPLRDAQLQTCDCAVLSLTRHKNGNYKVIRSLSEIKYQVIGSQEVVLPSGITMTSKGCVCEAQFISL